MRATVSDMGPCCLHACSASTTPRAGCWAGSVPRWRTTRVAAFLSRDLRAMVASCGGSTPRPSPPATAMCVDHTPSAPSCQPPHPGRGRRSASPASPCWTSQDLMQTDEGGPRPYQCAGRQPAHPVQPPSMPASCSGCSPSCSEQLPEIGDREKPVLVFFFDRPPAVQGCAQGAAGKELVVHPLQRGGRLFHDQSPADIPDSVLGQRQPGAARPTLLHPSDQKAVRIAANAPCGPTRPSTPPGNPLNWGSGRRLISPARRGGRPNVVDRAFIAPPGQPASAPERGRAPKRLFRAHCSTADTTPRRTGSPRSERLQRHRHRRWRTASRPTRAAVCWMQMGILFGHTGPVVASRRGGADRRQNVARTLGNEVGRQLMRGVLGSLLGSSKRRR